MDEVPDSEHADHFRAQFAMPVCADGRPALYLCGHSLGPQPLRARAAVDAELNAWASRAVEGHFYTPEPWYTYSDRLRPLLAPLVGAHADEVACMNGLTVNLHLLLASFYRPTAQRDALLIDAPTFPSDRYAALTQVRHHGLDPARSLLSVGPRTGEDLLREEDIEEILDRQGHRIAVVLLAGVNFLTGQWLDIPRLTRAAHRAGCLIGLDLAHAVGNVPLQLHDWQVDFAVWCTYKYLNAGPGSVGACFVHRRHGDDSTRNRLAGWWGNDPTTRFRMQLEPEFHPQRGADGWQVSNPPVLALAPLKASLELFAEATLPALRARSERLTGRLMELLGELPPSLCRVVTPKEPSRRGCMVCMQVPDSPRERLARLKAAGVICDFREPDVIRVAPAPLYTLFSEVEEFVRLLAR